MNQHRPIFRFRTVALAPPRPRYGTTVSGMTFYEEQLETGIYEGLTVAVDAFNASSGNALLLEVGARKGRKPVRTFIEGVSGLIQRRDPSSDSDTLTPTTFSNSEHRAIKIFRSAPFNLRRQDWVDMGLDSEEGTRLFGIQFGQLQVLDYLQAVASALVGAITAIGATAILDITGETVKTANFDALNRASFKLGDFRSALRTIVAHSKFYQDLIGKALTDQVIAFQVGNTTIRDGSILSLGLQQVMTDVDSLVNLNGSATDTYNTLLLVAGAGRVKTGPSGSQVSPVVGTATAAPANQLTRLSIEYEYEIEIKGVSYKAASGDNPNNAALATASNWELVGANVKQGPGVKLVHQ